MVETPNRGLLAASEAAAPQARTEPDSDAFRLQVIDQALKLFMEKGYDSTTVDEIAEAAGVSRRTFFRQFHSKEDVIFADHEILLARVAEFLAADHANPWKAVCDSSKIVLKSFSERIEFSAIRYQVVRSVPALRDREIVTVFRYEKLYTDYLRSKVPPADHLKAITFAAAATAAHNLVLRKTLRQGNATDTSELDEAAHELLKIFGVADESQEPSEASPELVVAVFPKNSDSGQILETIKVALRNG